MLEFISHSDGGASERYRELIRLGFQDQPQSEFSALIGVIQNGIEYQILQGSALVAYQTK